MLGLLTAVCTQGRVDLCKHHDGRAAVYSSDGQHGASQDTPLVDPEGYPRGDIDIVRRAPCNVLTVVRYQTRSRGPGQAVQ